MGKPRQRKTKGTARDAARRVLRGKKRRNEDWRGFPAVPRHLLHPLTPAFSAVLRRLRAKRRMSRYRLGKLANVSREWVAKIEEGACAFTIDLVARLCEALGHPFESVAAQAARHRRRNAR